MQAVMDILCKEIQHLSAHTVLKAILLCWVYKVQDEQEGRRQEESHTSRNCFIYRCSMHVQSIAAMVVARLVSLILVKNQGGT